MSRIRSIHPGLFSDEAFMALTVDHPLCIPLLLGLWTEADDDGVFEWKPLTIKAKVLPAAPVDMPAMLDVLVGLNFIMRYEVSGKPYGAIRNFKTWQRPKLPKVKHPKTDIASVYVGIAGEALPHDLPRDGEIPPQREEGGGKREDEKKAPPSPQGGEAADLFDQLVGTYPKSNHTKLDKAERLHAKLTLDDQRQALSQARLFEVETRTARQKRGREAAEHAEFVPGLDTWLREGRWKVAASAPTPIVPMTKLDRQLDAELWRACERVMGKPAPTSDQAWSFLDSVIDKARQVAA